MADPTHVERLAIQQRMRERGQEGEEQHDRSKSRANGRHPRWLLLGAMSLLASLLVACAGQPRTVAQDTPASTIAPDTGAPYTPGDTVAVLLPQSGGFASAAAAVRDGLLAAQRASGENERLNLRFYDSANTTEALTILERAAADGATLAIGPLQRDAVGQIARAQRLPMTTLALNDSIEGRLPPANLYRFALSPEDEAAAVAEAAKAQGFTSALILYPDDDWGTRIAKALIGHWQGIGGVIEAGQIYNAGTSTFDEPLQKLFQTERYAVSQRGLGTGADLIFFVGNEWALRAIRPQIRAVGADRLPIFTTSHVYSSSFQALRDNGLTGIHFVDIPWMVSPQRNAPAQSELRRGARGSGVDYQRLFALGLDAYRLAPIVAGNPAVEQPLLDGQTGVLRVDSERRIRRQLVAVRVDRSGFAVLE